MRITKRDAALARLHDAPLDYELNPVPEKRKPYKHPEDDLQKSCVEWLDIRVKRGDVKFTAINPRPGKKTFWQQSHDKAMGLRRGACDLLIWKSAGNGLPSRLIHCELKAPKGTLDEDQEEWRDWLYLHGFEWHLVRSADRLAEIIG